MHLAVDFDVLDHVVAVGFQSAVEVVQVSDTADFSCRGVEEFGRESFRERVVAFLFVARDEVVALFHDHSSQFGNLVGRVLQVGIHRDDDIALRDFEAAIQRRTLAVVAAKLDGSHDVCLSTDFLNHLPGTVGRTVVDENHFEREAIGLHHALDPVVELGQRFFFVIQRNDDGYIHFLFLFS